MAHARISVYLPPDINPSQAAIAYGCRALPKLNEELQSEDLLMREKALVALCDLLHDPEHVYVAIDIGEDVTAQVTTTGVRIDRWVGRAEVTWPLHGIPPSWSASACGTPPVADPEPPQLWVQPSGHKFTKLPSLSVSSTRLSQEISTYPTETTHASGTPVLCFPSLNYQN